MSRSRVYIIIFVVAFIAGCKSKKMVSDNAVSVIPIDKVDLVNRVEENFKDLKSIFFSKSLVQFESDKVSQTFRANIYLDINKAIRISILAPLGIEVARISLEPDSVFIIDRMSRNVVYTDYNEILRKFGVEIDFFSFQNILMNRVFSLFENKGISLYDYHLGIENKQYKLSSIKEKSNSIFSKKKAQILHKMWIEPGFFFLNRTSFTESEKNLTLDITYEDFEEEKNGFFFPGKLAVSGSKGLQQLLLVISHTNIDINGDKSISFHIPEKYDKIYR
jgi:hypothetical protein